MVRTHSRDRLNIILANWVTTSAAADAPAMVSRSAGLRVAASIFAPCQNPSGVPVSGSGGTRPPRRWSSWR